MSLARIARHLKGPTRLPVYSAAFSTESNQNGDSNISYNPLDYVTATGLFEYPQDAFSSPPSKRPPTEFEQYLKNIIKVRGPLSFSHYMREALTNPIHGYYMQKDVFGQKGDFITSPEISQMFGEIIGIWCIHTWEQMGKPPILNLVELGPGRGTLMSDILRVMRRKPELQNALRVHLIEVSEALSTIQNATLAHHGVDIKWHNAIDFVPENGPLLVIAHELFDALPVHLFRYKEHKTEGGWLEVLVDADYNGPYHLKMALSRKPGATSRTLAKWLPVIASDGDIYQISVESMGLAEKLALRITKQGGGALVIDYGENKNLQGAVVAIRDHKAEHVLANPGKADLSAWVDFKMLRRVVLESSVYAELKGWGPVHQGAFLREMGIDFRMLALINAVGEESEQAAEIIDSYNRLVDGKHMGSSYKVWALCHKDLTPAGFASSTSTHDDYID